MKVLIFNLIFISGLGAFAIIPMDKSMASGIIEGDFTENTVSSLSRQKRNALSDKNKLWPNGIIPYTISRNFNSYEVKMIQEGMTEFQQKTCIRFEPRTSSHWNYLDIIRGSGCSADVGRKGGRQQLTLGNGCFLKGIILHEFMHTIGFCHEQTRTDRDKHVKIIWENIIDKDEHNFHTLPPNQVQDLGEKYDFQSVMHYPANAFSINTLVPSIISKNSKDRITQQSGFSEIDLRQIDKLYHCNSKPMTRTTCTDDNNYCQQWAQLGECTINPAYMKVSCRKACRECN